MKFSIITVCFNSEAYIADTLRSVDQQSWRDIEHIVVDGASTDRTLQIIASFPKPWRYVVSEPDDGIFDAMNKGLDLCHGEIIGFVNSDDFYASPSVLEKIAQVFASDPALDACYGDLCYVRPDRTDAIVRYWRSSNYVPGSFARGWVPPHPAFFVRRRVYERLGRFDVRYGLATDFELMLRFLEVYRIKALHLPEILVSMRTGGASNGSMASIARQNREVWRALNAHGLQPSLLSFAVGKLVSRGKQLIVRPTTQLS